MKLIVYSIICGALGLLITVILGIPAILGIGGQASVFVIILFGLLGFFSPGIYVLDKLYEKSKEEDVKE